VYATWQLTGGITSTRVAVVVVLGLIAGDLGVDKRVASPIPAGV